MLYQLEYGQSERQLAKLAAQARQPMPSVIRDAPELEVGLQLYLQAYFDLDSERPSSGFGITAIPMSKVRQYAEEFELTEDQTENLIFYVQQMDGEYIKLENTKQKRKAEMQAKTKPSANK